MPDKPSFAYDYKKENVELVRQTCLYIATKLGDLLDELVVVGGLAPSLLIPDESLPAGEDVHIGTMDPDSVGPSRVAQFQYNEPNPDLQADVAGYTRELLERCSNVEW